MKTLILISTVLLNLIAVSVFGQTNKEEVINIDSILINNKVAFRTTVSILKNNFGKPDSIVTKTRESGNFVLLSTVTIFYYGKATFEIHGETAVLQKLDFGNGQFNLKSTHLTLDNNTTLNDLIHFSPSSKEKSYESTNPIDKKTYRLVKVKPTSNNDDQWVLKFYNDRLIEIEYWDPC